MGFNNSALNKKLIEAYEKAHPKVRYLKIDPKPDRKKVIPNKKIKSQYDNYRFSKDNPNPNWG